MKKRILMKLSFCVILLAGCSTFQSEEEAYLRDHNIDSISSCKNLDALKANIGRENFQKDKVSTYCEIDTKAKSLKEINSFIKAGYDAKKISSFLMLPYYREQNTARYLSYSSKGKRSEDIVKDVNIGLDFEFYTNVGVVKDTDDIEMLVNKFHKLPDYYVPEQMEVVSSLCEIGVDNGCSTNDIKASKVVVDAFDQFVKEAKKQGFDLKAISGFRGYEYQQSLYENNKALYGSEYADSYFTRPSYSEHNTGLTLDVTFDHEDYTELHRSVNYDWFYKHLADYGFILRYPANAERLTGISYESWHIRYIGKKSAQKVQKQFLCFEEYKAMLQN